MSVPTVSSSEAGVSREITILKKQGVHARPSAMFVKLAGRFQCDVFIEKDGEKVNGKSIMGLLMLAAGPGSRMRLHCQGTDAEAALTELCAWVENRFGES